MTKQDALQLLFIVQTAYPKYYKVMNKNETNNFVDLWASIFEDKPVNLVANALKAYIATDDSGYPPVPGAINKKIMELCLPDFPTELEAWQIITKAVSNSGYSAKEEFNKLPEYLQRLVGSPRTLNDWGMINTSDFNTVIQSYFAKSYRATIEREKEHALIPLSIREKAKELTGEYAEKTLKLHD
ncbi:MAG: replicative helicase loader/inhibitor [Novosphingobium sp.]|nr:replicative helicase loader/inhibitor [Novosphingobium sp.]